MKKLDVFLRKKYFILILFAKLILVLSAEQIDFTKIYDLSMFKGDSLSYLYGAKSYVETGSYSFNVHNDGVTEFVYRMPGMALLLVPLLYLFSFSTSVKLFILIQVFISSYACSQLFEFLKTKSKSKILNISLLFFLAFGSYINQYSVLILSETIAQSLFIIISCYLLKEKEFKLNWNFVGVCVMFTWLFFLRPFMIVFLPLFIIKMTNFFLLKTSLLLFIKKSSHVIFFITFLFIFIGLWTIRNYYKTGKPIFMEYSVMPEKLKSTRECTPFLYEYIRHFGGNQYTTPYDQKNSHYLWFFPDSKLIGGLKRPEDNIFPSVVFSDGITIDSLKRIRGLIDSTLSFNEGSAQRIYYFNQFKEGIKRLDNAVLNSSSFLSHLKNRKGAFIRFVYQPMQKNMFTFKWEVVNVFLFSLNWILNITFITVFILILSVFSLVKFSNIREQYFIILPSVFLFLLFVVYYNIKEERELFCYYPAFLIFGFESIKRINVKYREELVS